MWLEHRLRPMTDDGLLVPVLEEWAPSNRGVFAYYYRNRHMSPATRAVVEFLRRRAGGAALTEPARTAAE